MEKVNITGVLLFHVEYPDGRSLADVPFGDLDAFLSCVLNCNTEVVVRLNR